MSAGLELNAGDKLKTAAESTVRILFHSGHSTVLGQTSAMIIKVANQNKTNLDLFMGRLRSKVKKLSMEQDFTVRTPQAVCAVRGTDFDVSTA